MVGINTRKTFAPALLLAVAWSTLSCTDPEPPPPADSAFPPPNPFVADSAWPMSHRSSHALGSSPLPGPSGAEGSVFYYTLGDEAFHNTTCAATQMGQQGNIVTGTTRGVTSLVP